MNRILEGILNLILVLITIYLPFAFIIGEFNPLAWNVFVRSLYVLTIILTLYFAISLQNKK